MCIDHFFSQLIKLIALKYNYCKKMPNKEMTISLFVEKKEGNKAFKK